MTKKILQYNQEEVINLNLSVRDLVFINYLIDNNKLNFSLLEAILLNIYFYP